MQILLMPIIGIIMGAAIAWKATSAYYSGVIHALEMEKESIKATSINYKNELSACLRNNEILSHRMKDLQASLAKSSREVQRIKSSLSDKMREMRRSGSIEEFLSSIREKSASSNGGNSSRSGDRR